MQNTKRSPAIALRDAYPGNLEGPPTADLSHLRPSARRREALFCAATIAVIAIAGIGAAVSLHPLAALCAVVPIPPLWRRRQRLIEEAGGEERTFGVPLPSPGCLAELGSGYSLFNRLRVPCRGVERKLDGVVVGPNGIFVIKIKHCQGKITGSETDPCWRQHKSVNGRELSTADEFPSPIIEVKYGVLALRKYLASRGIRIWVQGIVVMADPRGAFSVHAVATPVLKIGELAGYIRSYPPRWPVRWPAVAVRAIEELGAGAHDDSMSDPVKQAQSGVRPDGARHGIGLEHIGCFMRDFATGRVEDFMKQDVDTLQPDPAAGAAGHPVGIETVSAYSDRGSARSGNPIPRVSSAAPGPACDDRLHPAGRPGGSPRPDPRRVRRNRRPGNSGPWPGARRCRNRGCACRARTGLCGRRP